MSIGPEEEDNSLVFAHEFWRKYIDELWEEFIRCELNPYRCCRDYFKRKYGGVKKIPKKYLDYLKNKRDNKPPRNYNEWVEIKESEKEN